jgi:hypothetical protein
MKYDVKEWTVPAELLDHGSFAVVWHERSEADLVYFDTVKKR